jgi:hypothetical protein
MEDKVKKMEEILGSKFEDWTQETLAKVLQSEEALRSFSPELVVHLLSTRKNENVFSTLLPIKYGFDIRAIKAKIEEQLSSLKEKGMPIEEYRKNILEMKKTDNPIFKIAVYLTEVASFGQDYDSSKDEADIRSSLDGFKKILTSLKIDEGFQVITELLDLLFPFREMYFQRYKVDLIKDDEEIKSIVDAVNSKAKEMMEFLKSIKADEEGEKAEEGSDGSQE